MAATGQLLLGTDSCSLDFVRQRAAEAAGVSLLYMGAAVMIISPSLTWIAGSVQVFGVPRGPVDGFHVHIRGLQTGPGRWMFGAGIALAVIAILATLLAGGRQRLVRVALLPALITASGVGYWSREVGFFGMSSPPLLALLGPLGVIAAIGFTYRRRSVSERIVRLCALLVPAVFVCALSASVGPKDRAFGLMAKQIGF
ncbi:MAG: hypothetical protein M3Y35_00830 [Actinomycetota bacterium]|nr:hypothetical protein [Actinomycetota bacterium]